MRVRSSWLALPLAVAVASLVAAARPPITAVRVHEWGTFTSVAGADGTATLWRPLSGPSDLPRFVTILNPNSIKLSTFQGRLTAMKATVRMETPVLYFYSPEAATVRVGVSFPQGLITEWYPRSTLAPRGIEWTNVRVAPGTGPHFPVDEVKSHDYAARDTDAAPLSVAEQHEKFLFYRGLATFPVPVAATVMPQNTVAVNTSGPSMRLLILVESDGANLGYRVVRSAGSRVTIERPPLTSSADALGEDLQAALIEQGLFAREAQAMVNTWRDSWFEKGMRLFYVLPQSSVDALLPLRIDPEPAEVVRAFVGRLEVVTPAMLTEVDRAIRTHDTAVLTQYGRFLEPIAERILATRPFHADRGEVEAAMREIAARQTAR